MFENNIKNTINNLITKIKIYSIPYTFCILQENKKKIIKYVI